MVTSEFLNYVAGIMHATNRLAIASMHFFTPLTFGWVAPIVWVVIRKSDYQFAKQSLNAFLWHVYVAIIACFYSAAVAILLVAGGFFGMFSQGSVWVFIGLAWSPWIFMLVLLILGTMAGATTLTGKSFRYPLPPQKVLIRIEHWLVDKGWMVGPLN